MGNMNSIYLSDEPALTPAEPRISSANAKVKFISDFIFSPSKDDVMAALAWHGAECGAVDLEHVIAAWYVTPGANREAVIERTNALESIVEVIVASYAEKVLWPEYKRRAA